MKDVWGIRSVWNKCNLTLPYPRRMLNGGIPGRYIWPKIIDFLLLDLGYKNKAGVP